MDKEKRGILRVLNKLVMNNKTFLILLFMVLLLGLTTSTFFTKDNILNVLRQVSVNVIVSVGFTFVIAMGGIDLSVGSIIGLGGSLMALLMVRGWPLFPVLIIGVLFGLFCGCLNASIITLLHVPPFIATLATSSLFRGACYLLTGMKAVYGLLDSFIFIGQGYLFGIPFQIYIMIIVVAIIYIIMNRTSFGRHVIAMGGNEEATRVCGINITKTRYGIFAVVGLCAGIGSVILTARSSSGQISAGQNMEMDAIASVVIGGTALSGGNANIMGTVAGCFIVGIVSNGLNLLGVDSNWQIIAKGIMILFAISVDIMSTRVYQKTMLNQIIAHNSDDSV